MSLEYLFSPTKQFTYPSGKLLDGGKIFVYFKDTTNLATLYSPEGSFVSNPILLDANGRASVRADVSYQYRLEIYTNKDVLLYTCEAFCEGDGSGGFSLVIHDETLSGNGTAASPLGVINIPLAVDETMTAYTATVEDKESLVLGVNGDWFTDTFGSALDGKVDWSAFSACCSAVKGGLDNKLDISAFDLSNYYNKQETNNLLDQRVDRYEFAQTMNWVDQTKQDKLEFGYDENSAISSINTSAIAGSNGEFVPWISGTKHIADTQLMTDNMLIQVLSSFDLSGNKNHCINVKGGLYRFPNQWEIASGIQNTNWFMEKSAMSAYLPNSSFSTYTSYASDRMDNIFQLANSAYTTAVNNYYNKLDISAFSSFSANLSGDYLEKSESANFYPMTGNPSGFLTTETDWSNTITAASSYAYNQATAQIPAPFDPTYISGQIDNKLNKSDSAKFYPMTGNPSGFLTAHQSLTNYYTKTDTSSKQQISAALQYISANAGKTYSGIDPIVVNNTTNQISADTWTFSAGSGLTFTDDNINKVTKMEVDGEELSAGPNIDIFASGGYVVISANGGNSFPITGTDGTANFTANANCSSFTLTTAQGAAGCYVNLDAKNVLYEAYPSTTISASWYNILNKANEVSSNCYCVKLNNVTTSVDLANYSAYDKVTVVHGQEYGDDYNLYWDGKTKVIHSASYCELVKVLDNNNNVKWTFTTSGWTNDNWWDWD